MSTTFYGVNAPEAVKLWSRKLAHEVRKATYIDKFIGESADSLIQTKTDTKKSPGDRITITLRTLLTGDGVVGDSTLENNEESLTTYTDNLVINQLRHAVRSQGKMSEQRIPFAYRDEAKDGLVQWWAERYDQVFFNQICGYTPANVSQGGPTALATGTGPAYTGMNTIIAPTSTRRIAVDGGSADESLGSTNVFTLQMIDKAVEKAKTVAPMIRPIMYKGDKYYVMFLHPYQVTDLRINTSAGQWLDIQKAALTGGRIAYGSGYSANGPDGKNVTSDSINPIFSGALGVYNGVILHELYFENLGGDAEISAGLAAALDAQGGKDKLVADLKACALGGPGWAILTRNRRDGKLHTYFLAEHHIGLPIDQDLLVVLDSWEHAFMVDYGIARAKYLDAFVENIKWSEVSKRFGK